MKVITEEFFVREVIRRSDNKIKIRKVLRFLDGEMSSRNEMAELLLLFSRSPIVEYIYGNRKEMRKVYNLLLKDITPRIRMDIDFSTSSKRAVDIDVDLSHSLFQKEGILFILYRLVYLEIGDDVPVYINKKYKFERSGKRKLKENFFKTFYKYVKEKILRLL